MNFLTRNWSVVVGLLAVQSALFLLTTPLLAHDGHRQSETEVERPAADSAPAPANEEPSMMAAPESEVIPETPPHTMPTSPSSISVETSPASGTATEGRPTLANATGRINFGLGELTFALLMTGPFLLKFIKRQLRN